MHSKPTIGAEAGHDAGAPHGKDPKRACGLVIWRGGVTPGPVDRKERRHRIAHIVGAMPEGVCTGSEHLHEESVAGDMIRGGGGTDDSGKVTMPTAQ